MVAQTPSFFKFWNLGYKALVPVVPPGSDLSPHSTMHKRLNAGKDPRGKAVGVKGAGGLWRGYDWLRAPAPDEDQLRAWEAMGASVGIRTGNGLVALDIDTLDQNIAAMATELAGDMLGFVYCRYGRKPKRLFIYRTLEPIVYQRVEFTGHDGKNERIELLADDRQFVAEGIHPITQSPYEWTAVPSYHALPVVSPTQIDAYFAALADRLPAAQVTSGGLSSVDRANVDQAKLKGSLARVEAAVTALPNTSELFPTYDDYIRVGAAIKGATQEDPELGEYLFTTWALKYPDNTAESALADYSRIKPPFEIGANYLYDLADRHAGTAFNKFDPWLQDEAVNSNPFLEAEAKAAADPANALEPLRLIAPMEWQGVEPKEREWEVEGWIPKGEVTLLYGDGGIGKTLLIHQYATAAAAGINWLGQPTRQARVLCFFCEDSEDELHRRQRDILKSMMLTYGDINENLRIAPRKFLDNAFAHWDRNTGALKLQAIWVALRDAAVEFRADVVVVDTIADVFAGSEIDRVQVNSFVKACLGRLASEINGTVIALGHPSMAGKASGSGTSGSTAWSNAARSRLFLRYPKGTEKGNARELEGMKSNYGPKGNLLKLRWAHGCFEAVSGAVLPISERAAGDIIPSGTGRTDEGFLPTVEGAAEQAVIEALAKYPLESLSLQSERVANYAPRFLKRAEPGLFESVTTSEIADAMERLLRADLIRVVPVGRRQNRQSIYGFAVVRNDGGGVPASALSSGVFE